VAWGIGRLRVVGERGREREKNRGYSQGTRRNYVAPGTDTLLGTYNYNRTTGSPFSTAQLGLLLHPYRIILLSRIPY
jgi:hypothetical protein